MSDAPKLTEGELLERLRDCPHSGAVYRHYKSGNLYHVVSGCIHESTQEAMVTYRATGSGVFFVRPLREWDEEVQHEGRTVKRFTPLEPAR